MEEPPHLRQLLTQDLIQYMLKLHHLLVILMLVLSQERRLPLKLLKLKKKKKPLELLMSIYVTLKKLTELMLKWLLLEKLEIDKLLAEFLIYKFLMAHLLELLMKHSTPVRFKLKTSPQLKRNSKLIITTWSRATMTLTLLKPTKKNGKSLPQEPT